MSAYYRKKRHECFYKMQYVYVLVFLVYERGIFILRFSFASFRRYLNFSIINPNQNSFSFLFSVGRCHLYGDQGFKHDRLFLHT